ncbi:MAG: NADH-quinone oxidoreductase subunit M [Sedimentisphaerales bacterium]|jgi:NADH-quinone oxidoreductase subunit M
MILVLLLIITLVGGLVAWAISRWNKNACRWLSLIFLFADLAALVILSVRYAGNVGERWFEFVKWSWIPQLGASFELGADGLSLLFLWLTVLLGIFAIISSSGEIQHRVGFFHFNLMLVLVGIIGVFTALDLFLFYFFWELMLVPMYFLISIWGHENRVYAAIKFFIFTQAGGLFMLASILALYFINGHASGIYTFDYEQLLNAPLTASAAIWVMLGFFVGFAVKLPVVPIHTWLPDAHTEAPTAGSVILAGLLLKTGAYGLLRFVLPLFAGAARDIAPAAMILAVVGIVYGAVLAFAQRDIKRLVAYTSISHLGFVLLGIFAGNMFALQGAVIIILAHGLSTGGLFILAGAIQERIHTRDMDKMGGLWATVPRMGGVAMFLALASLGLPGLGNFVGEFLVLLGAWQVSPALTVIASTGFIFSAIYSLWLIQKIFHGPAKQDMQIPDLGIREMAVMCLIMAGIILLGVYPQPMLDSAKPTLKAIQLKFVSAAEKTDVTQ